MRLTQAQLGELVGYERHQISLWERGKVPIPEVIQLGIWIKLESYRTDLHKKPK